MSNPFKFDDFLYTLVAFRRRIDNLSQLQTCCVCKEKYIGMIVRSNQPNVICSRCYGEKGIHRFSIANNMDPGEQPFVLKILSQVEEMLIARVAPVLQVSYARGGQYKYTGHTINFLQDITEIETALPRRFQ